MRTYLCASSNLFRARESVSRKRKGKREYLNDAETRRMMKELQDYFESKVEIPLIRHGKRQRIETLIMRKPCY